ncbi:MAG: hypothetical protein E7279_01495 [Lachnospiraceae bacterium]|nr:hypothetical protein [Lachnospiraceae bacterium]
MQSIQIYGELVNEPRFRLIKDDEKSKSLNVLGFDVCVYDNDHDNTTTIHCLTFNEFAKNVMRTLKRGKNVFVEGLMKNNKYFITRGVEAEKLVLLIKNINVDGDMFLSSDLKADLRAVNYLSNKHIYI